ncbi:uncharacterized protein PHACADRAFT_33492 [Phanerochaete carnosa HHB-10118-sp]|uniref:SAP domain-containing protein n=1 Tax=Phanerochaete carnosa (strain HHB-10118-sp) TaxID=650164 RepID=K5VRR4_PHACS|nr:uncharacterized protein PHACADRAFT_33492 [Phanerochaete carnosa HHB-10118-sp]EKM49450.1 hypothetical protein PHACADRAFT_33492 [Phanerochaete carnosa HHB-10118-sp]
MPQSSIPHVSTQAATTRRTRSSVEAAHIGFLETMTTNLVTRRATIATVDREELIFAFPPNPYEKITIPLRLSSEVNTGPYSLEFGRAANREVLEYEMWLAAAMSQLGNVKSARPAVESRMAELVLEVQSGLDAVEMLKQDEWQRRCDLQARARGYLKEGKVPVIDTSPYFVRPSIAEDNLSLFAQLIAATLFLLCNLSIARCSFILMSLRHYASMALHEANLPLDLFGPAASDVPHDVRTIVDGLNLRPSAVGFCCCPKCFCCYPIDDFPEFCIHQEAHDTPQCGKVLRRVMKNKIYPTRRYLHHDLKQWVGRLMRRPNMETLLDRDVFDTGAKPGEMRDIWNGEVLRQFQGDNKKSFIDGPKGEGRLVFALNMDAFHPFQNLAHGATNSSTAIYLIMSFGSHGSTHFCPYCNLTIRDLDNLDMATWPPGVTREEFVTCANQWKGASLSERNRLFEHHGIWYTELLRLSYWDPVKFVVIDSMHALLLGNLKTHCRGYWSMDVKVDDKAVDQKPPRRDPNPDAFEMKQAWELMCNGTKDEIGKLKDKVLKQLCKDVHLRSGAKRNGLLVGLHKYRQDQGWLREDGLLIHPHPPKPKRKDPVTEEEIEYARHEFDVTPSIKAVSSKLRKEVVVRLAESLADSHSQLAEEFSGRSLQSMTKSEITEVLSTYRDSISSVHSLPTATARPKAVLGTNNLSIVHEDIAATILPSWIGRVPGNLGSASHRTLSADEWRTACTVHLVTFTVRLWGAASSSRNERTMLENFMPLVRATKLAHMRIQTASRIEEYLQSMKLYLDGVIRLYPSMSLMPSHHLSLHFPRFLCLFGPVHAWRCFPFERYNHVLQQVNKNGKSGELEITMFENFCAGQEIRALMGSEMLPEPIMRCMGPEFERVFGKDSRGTLLNDMLAFREEAQFELQNTTDYTRLGRDLEANLRQLLWQDGLIITQARTILGEDVLLQQSITRRGVRFCSKSSSVGDSQVVFGDLSTEAWAAGNIREIIVWPCQLQGEQVEYHFYAIIEVLHQLSAEHAALDPYRAYCPSAGRPLLQAEYCQVNQLSRHHLSLRLHPPAYWTHRHTSGLCSRLAIRSSKGLFRSLTK